LIKGRCTSVIFSDTKDNRRIITNDSINEMYIQQGITYDDMDILRYCFIAMAKHEERKKSI